MSKLKKTLALLIAVIMLAALLPGCSGTANTNESVSSASASPSSSATTANSSTTGGEWKYTKGGPVSEKKITVSILTNTGGATALAKASKDLPVYQEIDKRLGVNIDWQSLETATYNDTVTIRLMSNDLPDMVTLGNQTLINKLVEDKFFYAYDDINYKENTPYAQILFQNKDYTAYEKNYRNLYSDKKIYSFSSTVLPRLLYGNLIVNTKWLDKLGLKEPSTLDEFTDMLKAFRDKDLNGNNKKDELPFAYTTIVDIAFAGAFSLDVNSGGWNVDENGKLINICVTKEYKDYLAYRKMIFDEGLIDKEKRPMTNYYELIAADRLGACAYFGTFQSIISGYSPYWNKDTQDYVFREILPLENKYTGKRTMYTRLSSGTGGGMFILKASKYPEECLRITDWLWASDEYESLRYLGVEGLSYKKDSNGKIEIIQPADYKGAVSYLISIGGGQPPFINRQSEMGWRYTYPQWMFDRAEEIQPYYIDGTTPFFYDQKDTEETGKYLKDVQTYRDEMMASFIEGRTPLSQFDDYVKKINEMGMTKFTELTQKKYDARKK